MRGLIFWLQRPRVFWMLIAHLVICWLDSSYTGYGGVDDDDDTFGDEEIARVTAHHALRDADADAEADADQWDNFSQLDWPSGNAARGGNPEVR
jgi:hypothetical protein